MCKKFLVALAGFLLFVVCELPAQQTALTEGQLKAAEIEVPQLVELLELKTGMTIADVGAGFGAWTMRFSRWIGPNGRVYATDLGAPQLTALRDTVKREQLTNVTVLEGATAATNLPALCCDAILIRDAYHHFTQPDDDDPKPGGVVEAGWTARDHRLSAAREVGGAPRRSHQPRWAWRAAGSSPGRSGRSPVAREDDSGLGTQQSAGVALPCAVPQVVKRVNTWRFRCVE